MLFARCKDVDPLVAPTQVPDANRSRPRPPGPGAQSARCCQAVAILSPPEPHETRHCSRRDRSAHLGSDRERRKSIERAALPRTRSGRRRSRRELPSRARATSQSSGRIEAAEFSRQHLRWPQKPPGAAGPVGDQHNAANWARRLVSCDPGRGRRRTAAEQATGDQARENANDGWPHGRFQGGHAK